MKIALVVHKFPPASLGGTEIYTRDLARELARRHEIHLFYREDALPDQPYAEEKLTGENWHAWRVRYTLAGAGDNPLRIFLDTFQNRPIEASFARFLDETRPDIVHFQHVMGLSAGLLPLAKARRLPIVLTLHDYWFLCSNSQLLRPDYTNCQVPINPLACVDCAAARVKLPALRLLRPAVALPFIYRYRTVTQATRCADLYLCPSRFLQQMYIDGGFPADRTVYLENGLALDRLQGVSWQPASDGRLRVVYLGAIAWQKGVHILAQAFQGIPPEAATLRIYGDPAVFPDYARQVASLLTGPNAQLMGRVESEQVRFVLADADLLVVPSVWYENAPMVIQEAAALGVPVLAADIGALPEKVQAGVNGLLFRAGDAADLRAKLQQLIARPEQLARLRQGVRPPRPMSDHAAELETCYGRLVLVRRETPDPADPQLQVSL